MKESLQQKWLGKKHIDRYRHARRLYYEFAGGVLFQGRRLLRMALKKIQIFKRKIKGGVRR
jgi:hypothetical protein